VEANDSEIFEPNPRMGTGRACSGRGGENKCLIGKLHSWLSRESAKASLSYMKPKQGHVVRSLMSGYYHQELGFLE